MAISTTTKPKLLTTAEAAEILNVSQRTVQSWIDKESIPYIKLPSSGRRNDYRIPLGALLDSLSGNYDLAKDLKEVEEAGAKSGLTEEEAAEIIVND